MTSIRIKQCPVWSRKTDHLFQGVEKGGVLNEFRQLLKQCKKYDVVITSGSRGAQLFAFYKSIFRRKNPKHIILELMLDEARNDTLWKIKLFFQRICFSSVEVIFVSAKREIDAYAQRLGLPKDRIRFLPFHTNIINPEIVPGSGGYIFSAGRTGRDFATLAAAVEGLDVRVVVVSDQHHLQGISFPPNVEVYCDIPYEQYMELLRESSMVVVPLKKLIKSTGQVVILEAMALGKPVVATETIGTGDYIQHGVTGWLVHLEDSSALREAVINFIEHPEFYQNLAENAFENVKERHTFNVYTNSILKVAGQLCNVDLK